MNLGFLVVFFVSNPMEVVYGFPAVLQIAVGLPWLSFVLVGVGLIFAVLAWKENVWTLAGRICYTLVIIAVCVFVWQLHWWYVF
jgi:hypothetical protein